MKIFTSSQVKEIDRLTIANEPIESVKLMERASMQFTSWFVKKFDNTKRVVVFAGSGNNGGDALAVSRMLIERNYKLRIFTIKTGSEFSADCKANLNKLKSYTQPVLLNPEDGKKLPQIEKDEIVIDGIFGSGLNRPVQGFVAGVIRHINQHAGCIVSIDIPSGLFGEDNRDNPAETIIKASYTVSFEFPFLSFFFSGNEKYTGRWEVIPIGLHKESVERLTYSYSSIDAEFVAQLLLPREQYSHKGTYGHALVIAGRYGMMGAAVLCSKACLRGGAGLTTACIPERGFGILQTAVPESLIQSAGPDDAFCKAPVLDAFQSVACGPATGTGKETATALYELICSVKVPLVLDADALTILSEHKDWMDILPAGTIITPHPKEFDRLAGPSDDMYSRHLKQLELAKKYDIVIVLKGAHTIVSGPAGDSYINTTGNPGMASGGMGDVLTGLLVSLLAQGYSPLNASCLAVYIHGLAADLALEGSSMEALIAGDVIENIGKAFRLVKGKA